MRPLPRGRDQGRSPARQLSDPTSMTILATLTSTKDSTNGWEMESPLPDVAAPRYGASAEEDTPDPKQAYKPFERPQRGRPSYSARLPWASADAPERPGTASPLAPGHPSE